MTDIERLLGIAAACSIVAISVLVIIDPQKASRGSPAVLWLTKVFVLCSIVLLSLGFISFVVRLISN
jgi:hypothetical protein